MKTETIAWKDFFAGKVPSRKKRSPVLPVITTAVVVALLTQDMVHAHSTFAMIQGLPVDHQTAVTVAATPEASGWDKAKHEIRHLLDYVCWGVIVFCGGMWIFGHKSKALDWLLSCGIGTVIIIHADDIENFFMSL